MPGVPRLKHFFSTETAGNLRKHTQILVLSGEPEKWERRWAELGRMKFGKCNRAKPRASIS